MAAQKCRYFSGLKDKMHFKSEMLEVLRSSKQRHRKSKKKDQTKELLVDLPQNNSTKDALIEQELEILERIEKLKEVENSSESDETSYDDDDSDINSI